MEKNSRINEIVVSDLFIEQTNEQMNEWLHHGTFKRSLNGFTQKMVVNDAQPDTFNRIVNIFKDVNGDHVQRAHRLTTLAKTEAKNQQKSQYFFFGYNQGLPEASRCKWC